VIEMTTTDTKPTEANPGRSWLRETPLGTALVLAVTTMLVLAGVWLVQRGKDSSAQGAATAAEAAGGFTTALGEKPTGDPPKVGKPAPDIVTFSTEGEQVILSDLKGKPVWLVFGTSWCINCRSEAPDIEAVHQAYGDKVEVVGVYVGESVTTADEYATRLGLTFPQVGDLDERASAPYRVLGYPTHVFVDAEGNVSDIVMGTLTQRGAKDRLDPLLG
jgi:thiol-disulfide isomerase/thioredoxin